MLTGIFSVVLIMFLAGNLPNTVCYVRRSQEQRENVTYVTRRRDKWGSCSRLAMYGGCDRLRAEGIA